MQDYHKLEVWQRGMTYAVRLYEASAELSADERYTLVSQMRKAALSIPLNIAEGSGCMASTEFARFLEYAYRSTKETVTCLELWQRLYPAVGRSSLPGLIAEGEQIARMLYTLSQRVSPRPTRRASFSPSRTRRAGLPVAEN